MSEQQVSYRLEPIVPGDRVEVQNKAGNGFGIVERVEWIVRPFTTPHGLVDKPAPVYFVRLRKGRKTTLVKTQTVSYAPEPATLAARAKAIREANPHRQENTADFVGYDGPGIRCTNLAAGPKVVAP